jgi:dTDP-4-amino-4,6-dideoxy-D-galactose acyltransferase
MSTGDVGEVLPWDSEFFGLRIGRVTAGKLTAAVAVRLEEWARDEALQCLYFLADADDSDSIRAAEEMGFRHVDVRVTRARALAGDLEPAPQVVPAEAGDLPVLREIARHSHRATRFYHDPRFPKERCDDLYVRWLDRGLERSDQQVLVAREAGEPRGYIVCAEAGSGCGQVSLIAVAPAGRGSGVGAALVRGGLAWMVSRGCSRAEVVSQGRNVAASQLYERLGFLTVRMEHWFHLWLDEARP